MSQNQKQSQDVLTQVVNAVEGAGKEVMNQVSELTSSQPENLTEDAIQAAVDNAIDVLRVAGDQVREKGINAERVTIKAGVGIPNIAQVEISTDVPSKREVAQGKDTRGQGFDVKVSDEAS